ncbi:putative adenylate cyclase / guanylate cyclase [Spirochaeta thermophila DSM 6192]|uniref:Putative adenylate cyclase / guanylate cyclase n=2 Tax=Winmispira thermophila TaxID=154 RepID=E0RP16_WINT6|nr:putative adenylate cyclase / guanylate cyclase [Spirochaeta thermophila DSM 6192]
MASSMRGLSRSIVVLFFLGVRLLAADPVIPVTDSDRAVHIGGRCSYWKDTTGTAGLDHVLSLPPSAFEEASGEGDVSFGFERNPMWFRLLFEYKGGRPASFLLVLDYSLVDDVWLYLPQETGGWRVLGSDTYTGSHRPVFPVELRPGRNTMYLRIATEGTLRLPLHLYEEHTYRVLALRETAAKGLYLGAILLAAFINLFFFYVYKRESDGIASLFLSVFILFYGIFQSVQDGFVLFFMPKHIVPLFRLYVICGVLGLVALSFFMIFFFRREDESGFFRIFSPFWGAALLLIVLTFLTEPGFYVKAFALIGVVSFIPSLWIVLRAPSRKVFLGRELLYVYMLLIASVVIFGLRGLGFLPSNRLTLNIIPAGFLVFIVLLTLIQFKRLQTSIEEKYTMERNWKELYEASSTFVPREFLSFMHRGSIKDVRLGDQTETELTLMFSDIRNFTSIVESLTPAESFEFLNGYFECVGPIIRKHHGFIDKYIGDGVMAIFPHKADDALAAALEIQQALPALNRRYESRGWPSIRIGIGIHTGPCMVGTVGEDLRMDTTVISDVVNIAARLENLTKTFGTDILISEQVVMSLADPGALHLRFLGKVMVKGKSSAVSVFQVLTDREFLKEKELRAAYDSFEQGMFAFFKRDFATAISLFNRVLEVVPSDMPARVYLEQAMTLHASGVPEGWDGYLRITS